MRIMVILQIFLIMTCFFALTADAGEPVGEHDLILRVYNSVHVPRADVAGAVREATDILQQAGVSAEWRDCGFGLATAAPDCRDVLGSRELAIRIVRGPTLLPGGRQVFGFSHVDTGTGIGTLATVFGDRVAAAAERTGMNTATLLGRTVAHEVGHLLLGTAAHTPTGLMREVWADVLLRRRTAIDDWRFTASEAVGIRQGILARSSEASARLALHAK